MKKILIVSHTMELGGAEKALLGLLESIDYSRCSVDLFLERHFGELFSYIPEKVNILPENRHYASLGVPLSAVIKNLSPLTALGRFRGKKAADKYIKEHSLENGFDVLINYSHAYTVKYMPKISKKEYDLVISFLTPHYFALKKTSGKIKAAWLHTDYTAIELDSEKERAMWSGYDKIVSISKGVTQSFLKVFPEFSDKIIEIKNIIPETAVLRDSLKGDVSSEMPLGEEIRLLSIGRFCTAKNFDNVPYICRELIENHSLKIKWYIIGYGTDEKLIKDAIEAAGMQENVIILGKKENPYPYIRQCDFYVQPSRFEGNAVTVNEALTLGKKVILTSYPTAASQVKNGFDGVIVPQGNSAAAKGIADFIKNKALQKEIEKNVGSSDYSNAGEINKVYDLLK